MGFFLCLHFTIYFVMLVVCLANICTFVVPQRGYLTLSPLFGRNYVAYLHLMILKVHLITLYGIQYTGTTDLPIL